MKATPKLYLTRAGRNGEDEDLALENNLAIIEFRDIPTLEGAADYDAIVNLVREALPDQKPGDSSTSLDSCGVRGDDAYRDLVVLPRKLTSQSRSAG